MLTYVNVRKHRVIFCILPSNLQCSCIYGELKKTWFSGGVFLTAISGNTLATCPMCCGNLHEIQQLKLDAILIGV